MKNYDTNALLKDKFNETYNEINFLFVFKYMSDYVDVDKSSKLNKFYMKDELRSFKLFHLSDSQDRYFDIKYLD